MRLFLISREHPWCEFEVVSFDQDKQTIVLRGKYGGVEDEFEVDYPTTDEANRKRKLNYRLERRDA